jgi:hypothetical protein
MHQTLQRRASSIDALPTDRVDSIGPRRKSSSDLYGKDHFFGFFCLLWLRFVFVVVNRFVLCDEAKRNTITFFVCLFILLW